jgi:hypothetical protein
MESSGPEWGSMRFEERSGPYSSPASYYIISQYLKQGNVPRPGLSVLASWRREVTAGRTLSHEITNRLSLIVQLGSDS